MSEHIWGRHALISCLEHKPELIIKVYREKDHEDKSFALHESNKIQTFCEQNGFSIEEAKQVPRSVRERRHQGWAAEIKSFDIGNEHHFLEDWSKREINSDWVYLDRVQDVHNYGAIIRSAAAFGISGVIVGGKSQAPINGSVAEISAGNLFAARHYVLNRPQKTLLENLGENTWLGALDARGADINETVQELKDQEPRSRIWVLGSESEGLSSWIKAGAQSLVSLPIRDGVESLNVSNAAAITFFIAQKFRIESS